jgi:hypothetical protein
MVSLAFSFDTSAWRRAFEGGLQRARSLRPALEEVGNIGVAITQRNIEASGGPISWPPLAPSTLMARARHPNGPGSGSGRQAYTGATGARALTQRTIGSAKPLIWTRELIRKIKKSVGDNYVDYGSDLVKSWTLFLGSRPGKKPEVPARNPFGRTAADNAAIIGAFMRHLFGHLRGQA